MITDNITHYHVLQEHPMAHRARGNPKCQTSLCRFTKINWRVELHKPDRDGSTQIQWRPTVQKKKLAQNKSM